MNFRHRVAHLFGLNDWYRELTVDNGSVVTRDRCNGCGEVKNELVLYSEKNIDLQRIFKATRISN